MKVILKHPPRRREIVCPMLLTLALLVLSALFGRLLFLSKQLPTVPLFRVPAVYRALKTELECFPVSQVEETWFADSWMAVRTYGGERRHEGCDIFDVEGEEGRLTVCSASDGTVEKLGWLELGGYRVGIRTRTGLYFYYAHLAEYAPGLAVGQKIHAGEPIGTMGSTGYGKEGTSGSFAVHLHFGIYVSDKERERSINPYPFLKKVVTLEETMLQ